MRAGMRMIAVAVSAVGVMTLVPGWVGAQDAVDGARRTACQSNQKQLLNGLLMYAQDYDEKLPPASKWATNVMPYVKNRRTFQCPADSSQWSYAFNKNLSGVSMGQIPKPGDTTMLFESNFHKPNAFGLANDVVYTRHLGHGNFGYVDGHVKSGRSAPPFGPVNRPRAKPRRR